ncbi:ABC transporter ATP-binding protein [Inquilinus sp. Marseille-Q2685]|uniref:ABC transporter ATP-binding protein n=1 Tax=Inquilinus sp. Marseille-Q2685 TaxID=2866581 RepID=UPI001CE42621|nr:ATP-binding cassette domain-containing protein [Inquilinus sp. Marseille-Q2685]
MTRAPLLAVENLTTRFDLRSGVFGKVTGRVHAVENVSFEIFPGETLALVGESGCGKSTIGRSILQLDRPVSGSIRFEGRETLGQPAREIQALRRQVQMVFQDPFSSLNPRMTVGQAIADPMLVHGGLSRAEIRARVAELLRRVGLSPEHARRHPHAFSGGQRQRICIARALSTRPKLVIADEAVASLDVTIQAQVINLLMDLQAETGIAVLFISHDMAVVERMAHRVAVMYLGQIVEIGSRREVFGNPRHSYTRKLLSSVPVADPRQRPENRALLADEIPSAVRPPDFEPAILPMQQVSDRHFVRAEV